MTNAAKHGEGTIDVHFEDDGKAYALIVSDDGRNLSPDFDPSAANKSLGMRVVSALAKQLNGKMTAGHRPDGGSCFKVAFPNSSG